MQPEAPSLSPAERDGTTRPHRDRRGAIFLLTVFVAIICVVAATFYVFSLQPPSRSSVEYVVFSTPTFLEGNASIQVQSVKGGPYTWGGFHVDLVVNDFAGPFTAMGPNQTVVRISIGPHVYRITWDDVDGDRNVSVADTFLVALEGGPLPSLSAFEFDLRWQNSWTAESLWTTG